MDFCDLNLDLLPIADDPGELGLPVEEALDRLTGPLHGDVADEVSQRDKPDHHRGRLHLPLQGKDGCGRGVQGVDVELALLCKGLKSTDKDWHGRP